MKNIKYLFVHGFGNDRQKRSSGNIANNVIATVRKFVFVRVRVSSVRVSSESVKVSEFTKFEMLASACCLTAIWCKDTGGSFSNNALN